MLITVKGGLRVVAMKATPAVAPEGAEEPETEGTGEPKGEGKEETKEGKGERKTPAPRPRRKATQAERWRRHEVLMAQAEARYLARLDEESKLDLAGKELLGQEDPGTKPLPRDKRRRAPEAPETADPRLFERMVGLGVFLTPRASDHIFNQHGAWKVDGKSQFHERFRNREELDAFVAKGVLESGAIGAVVCTDRLGRFYTLCRADRAGWVWTRRGYVETDRFVVVTQRYWDREEEAHHHTVITAYPVSPNW
jgi:hypothetical protein